MGFGRTLLAEACARAGRRYGLQTDDYKTVWKLLLTAEGHPHFFDALAYWVKAGGELLFTNGNDDVELHWPLVQKAIRWELAARDAVEAHTRVDYVEGHVVFKNLYVEHGHQYDEMTRVDGPAELPPDNTQINLPLGSFVNRYFINRVEALDPFIDNAKPVQQSLLRLARQRPLKIFTTYFGGWRFLRRAIAKRRFNKSVALIALGLILPIFTPPALLAISGVRNTVLGWLPIPEGARAVVVVVIGFLLSGAFPWVLSLFSELTRHRPSARSLERREGPDHACGAAIASRHEARRIPAASARLLSGASSSACSVRPADGGLPRCMDTSGQRVAAAFAQMQPPIARRQTPGARPEQACARRQWTRPHSSRSSRGVVACGLMTRTAAARQEKA